MEARASNGGISITRNRSSPSPSTERYMGLFSRSHPENANGGSVLSASDVGDDLDEDEVFWTGDFSQSTHRSNPPTAGVVNRNHQPLGFRRTENFGILAALPEEDKKKKEDEEETLGDVPVMVKIGASRSIPRPQSPSKKRDYSLSLPSGKLTQSAPVNVPVLSKAAAAARAKRHTVVEEEDEDDDDQEILPPHEIVARASASRSPWTTFSVLEGVGRTLKGRDLRQVLEAPHGDLLSCMEMAKVADLIAFVASASCCSSSSHMDSFATQCLSVFKTIGMPNSVVLIRDLPKEMKKRNDFKQACISSLSAQFPEDSKFFPADSKDELHKFMDIFKEQRLTPPLWRRPRPYLMAHEVDLIADDTHPGTCTLLLSGYLRARNLSVNQLVHVSGTGDFQLSKIDVLNDPCPLNLKKKHDLMDSDELHSVQVIRSLVPDASKQEPLLVENIPDPLAGEQTWPTEAEMAEADEMKKKKKMKRKVPRGTSEYQAAWILDDSDNNDSDADDDENDGMALDEDEDSSHCQDLDEYEASVNLADSDGETEADTMMTDGEHMTKEQVEAEILKIKAQAEDDEGFPDEVDTPVDKPARDRFMKYRGIKSWKTSSWDPKESLPPEYARIFEFDNFKRTQKLVLTKALHMQEEEALNECVPAGSYVRLHVKEVPLSAASKLRGSPKTSPLVACGLLQHESKMSVLHFSIKKHDTYDAPIKAKEPLVFHVGFRQFIARPIFSPDGNSDKHKMERFLHAGISSVASVYAPISFPPQNLVVLKCGQGEVSEPVVAAVGHLRSIDPDRLILKRIILTGYPQRVSKSKATVRFMFHNPEDVRFFKPVEVWTKCGRRGRVIESVGTHGVLKCKFDGVVQQHDTVCMSLFKRVYPKWPERLIPLPDA